MLMDIKHYEIIITIRRGIKNSTIILLLDVKETTNAKIIMLR